MRISSSGNGTSIRPTAIAVERAMLHIHVPPVVLFGKLPAFHLHDISLLYFSPFTAIMIIRIDATMLLCSSLYDLNVTGVDGKCF